MQQAQSSESSTIFYWTFYFWGGKLSLKDEPPHSQNYYLMSHCWEIKGKDCNCRVGGREAFYTKVCYDRNGWHHNYPIMLPLNRGRKQNKEGKGKWREIETKIATVGNCFNEKKKKRKKSIKHSLADKASKIIEINNKQMGSTANRLDDNLTVLKENVPEYIQSRLVHLFSAHYKLMWVNKLL